MPAPPLSSVDVGTMPLERFATVLRPEQLNELQEGIRQAPALLDGRRVWNVSSTANGGGVAEMLTTLLAYARGIDVDARWEVIGGGAGFFELTKRIHNRLHGFPGDGGPLGDAERDLYEAGLVASGEALSRIVRPGDIVILHDPQTAGLVPVVRACGVPAVWRCHVGVDEPNALARETSSPASPSTSLRIATRTSCRPDRTPPESRTIPRALVCSTTFAPNGHDSRGIFEHAHLAVLPVADPQENGAIVNALQRSAAVVVQKSLGEGFGLTVAEAMWRGRRSRRAGSVGSRTR